MCLHQVNGPVEPSFTARMITHIPTLLLYITTQWVHLAIVCLLGTILATLRKAINCYTYIIAHKRKYSSFIKTTFTQQKLLAFLYGTYIQPEHIPM